MTHRSSTTRRLAALAVLGVVALGGTNACASGSATTSPGGSSSGSPSAGASTGGPVPSLVPLPTEVPPTTPPSTAPGGAGTAPATPSGLKAASYTAVDTTLTVNFYAGVCSTYSLRADQTSTPGEVKVTVLAKPKTAKGQMCPQLVQLQSVSANLGSPLDQRTVVDTASGKAVPLAHPIPGGTKMTHGPVHN